MNNFCVRTVCLLILGMTLFMIWPNQIFGQNNSFSQIENQLKDYADKHLQERIFNPKEQYLDNN